MNKLSFSCLVLAPMLGALALSSAQEKPNVTLVSMGGTIASMGRTRMDLNNYGGPGLRVGPDIWLYEVPEVQDVAHVTSEDLRPPPDRTGGTMYSDLFRVANRLQELAEDDSVDGIVVTHGTNTLAETAWFMHLTVSVTKPIVFVGSQRPWNAISGDGPLNLYNAVRVAATPEAGGMGVLHMMNDTLNGARGVTKAIAYRVETFQSLDTGPLGYADADRVVIYERPLRKHTSESRFNIRTLPTELPKVEVLYAYMEAPGYLVDALVENGVKGIVIDGTGAGALGGYSDAIKRAQEKGIVVVATARTRGGRVQDTPRRREAMVVPGDNLAPEKARILLALALTQTADVEEISTIFSEY